jgi:hypothetical protein
VRLHGRSKMLLFFLFIITYAHSEDVHYNYKRGADLFAYRTYQWVESPNNFQAAASGGREQLQKPAKARELACECVMGL